MKNKTKSLAITAVVALAAVVGLTASGCRSDENSNATHSQSADQNDGKKINPFDGLEVSFGGLVYDGSVYGDITFEANTDGCAAFVKEYVTFDCDTTNAANGSTVMVQAKWDATDAKDNGVTVTAVEQLYTVSLEEIPEDLTEDQRKQLADSVWDAAMSKDGGEYPVVGEIVPTYHGKWKALSVSEPVILVEKYLLADVGEDIPKTVYKSLWEIDVTVECVEVGFGDKEHQVGDVIDKKFYVYGDETDFTVKEDAVQFAEYWIRGGVGCDEVFSPTFYSDSEYDYISVISYVD